MLMDTEEAVSAKVDKAIALEKEKGVWGTMESSFCMSVLFRNRLQAMGFECDQRTFIFMGMLIENPGDATIMAAYFACRMKKLKEQGGGYVMEALGDFMGVPDMEMPYPDDFKFNEITIAFTSSKIMPLGYPNETTLTRLWDMQKIQQEGKIGDNLLDLAHPYQSLRDFASSCHSANS